MDILVAGGAGHTGGAICGSLIERGHRPIVVDSANVKNVSQYPVYEGDISDHALIKRIFNENSDISMCIHCAEIASSSLSIKEPYEYYYGNVVKSMDFFKRLKDCGIKKIIFSSSAVVYDEVPGQVVTENSPVSPRNPFGRAKYMTETILKDFCRAYDMRGIVMRSFNSIGVADSTCNLTDTIRRNSILWNLLEVINGERSYFEIAGGDWETRDGTCIRDYIHIDDVTDAHIRAAELFDEITSDETGCEFEIINIGSGIGVTVLEFIAAFENITGEKIKTVVGKRRKGDSAGVYANIKKAEKLLKWKPRIPVEEAMLGILNNIGVSS